MNEKEEKMNEKMRKKLMKVESFLKKKMMNFLRKKENEKVKEKWLKVGEKTRKKERESVGVVVMNKSIKNNSIFFDFKHQDKMTNMNSFKIFKVVPEIFEMLNCRFIQGCDLVDFLLEGPEQSNIFSFKLLQDTFNLRSVNFHIESHHLLNSSKLIGFFLPDLSSLAVCPIDSITSLATDSLTSLLSSSEISEISSIFFFNCSSFTSLNVSTNACLATEDQLIQSVLSISDFNSLGTDSVIAPIFNLQSNYLYYLYYLYTKDIFKSFGEKKLNVSNFKLQLITQEYSSLQEGKELYFLDENNKPIKVKLIKKQHYTSRIYDVDVENDIVLVRRKVDKEKNNQYNSNGVGFSLPVFGSTLKPSDSRTTTPSNTLSIKSEIQTGKEGILADLELKEEKNER